MEVEPLSSKALEDKVCIFVGEMQDAVLHNMDGETFEKIRRMLVGSRGVLWVTCGAQSMLRSPNSRWCRVSSEH